MNTKQPEALRLAEMLERPGYGWNSTIEQYAAELRRQHAEIETLRAGYDAARLEVASLQAEVAKYRESMTAGGYVGCVVWAGDAKVARHLSKTQVSEWRSPVIALQVLTDVCASELARFLAKPGGSAEPLRKRPVFGLPGTRDVDVAAAQKAWDAAQAQPVGIAPEWWRKRADEIETDVARGGSIAAMSCYTKMRQLLQAATSPQPAVQSLDAREFPAMTPELAAILGTMCFETINLAKILRSAGQDIKTRAEDEQAAVLHWMLSLWFKHGEGWRQAAAQEVMRIKDAAIAAQQGGA